MKLKMIKKGIPICERCYKALLIDLNANNFYCQNCESVYEKICETDNKDMKDICDGVGTKGENDDENIL